MVLLPQRKYFVTFSKILKTGKMHPTKSWPLSGCLWRRLRWVCCSTQKSATDHFLCHLSRFAAHFTSRCCFFQRMVPIMRDGCKWFKAMMIHLLALLYVCYLHSFINNQVNSCDWFLVTKSLNIFSFIWIRFQGWACHKLWNRFPIKKKLACWLYFVIILETHYIGIGALFKLRAMDKLKIQWWFLAQAHISQNLSNDKWY